MPALMKASPNITAHYRSGSHTISAVWPTPWCVLGAFVEKISNVTSWHKISH